MRKGLALSPEGWRLFVQQSVENNLLLGATPLADKSKVGADAGARLRTLSAGSPSGGKQRAGTMSGGERQMLAVGRALMSEPKLLLLDEPSLGLAPAIIETMYETFQRLHKAGLTLLLAEQSVDLALEVASYAYVLQVGRSVLSGTSARAAQQPGCAAHLPGRRLRSTERRGTGNAGNSRIGATAVGCAHAHPPRPPPRLPHNRKARSLATRGARAGPPRDRPL